MVLLLKQWKSRSSPGFAGGARQEPIHDVYKAAGGNAPAAALSFSARTSVDDIGAGWSSPVARQAHNLKVAGSNPAPATNSLNYLPLTGSPANIAVSVLCPQQSLWLSSTT